MSLDAIPQISAKRRRTDRTMRALLATGTVIALVPLVLVVYYLLAAVMLIGYLRSDRSPSVAPR